MWDGPPEFRPSLASQLEDDGSLAEEIYERTINFDRTLPGLHKYLGGDFISVGGRTILEPDFETQLYAFYRSGVILVPGQTLPLIPYGPFESSLLKRVHKERLQLIFLPGCFDRVNSLDEFTGYVGTTADLSAIRLPDNGDEETTIHAIFVGRQRILIEKVTHTESYPLVCRGRILPEMSVDYEMAAHPMGHGLVPRSWSRFGTDPGALRVEADRPRSPATNSDQCKRSHGRKSSRQSQDSSSHSSSSSSASYHSASCVPLSGNPFSIFDTRLSTWRHFGPLTTGCPSSTRSSPRSQLDHFEEDPIVPESEVKRVHSSAPELACKPQDQVEHQSTEPPSTESDHFQDAHSAETSSHFTDSQSDDVTEQVEVIMARAVDKIGRPFRYVIRQSCHPRLLARRDVLAAVANAFLPLPVWVYRQYDVNFLVSAIQTELLNWNDTWHVDRFSPDLAVPFSYWLIQNLPVPGLLKSKLLEINHVVPRLRALLDLIHRSSTCTCSLCDASVTSTSHIICLAQEGSSQTYVNPAGVLHDIVTVSQVTPSSVIMTGSPSEEYSWFPGYAWTITNCANCSHHLGWLFTAVKEDLKPRRFWGMRREAIVTGLMSTAEWRPSL